MVGRSLIAILLIATINTFAQVTLYTERININSNCTGFNDTAYVYFEFGQSNMGQSDADLISVDSSKYDGLIAGVQIFNPLNSATLQDMDVGGNTNIRALGWENNLPRGFDGEAVLGYQMNAYVSNPIVFYKVGVGSSTLADHWRKGDWLYDTTFVKYAPQMIQAIMNDSKYPLVKGVIWNQGESDVADSATYYGYLEEFFDSVTYDMDALYTARGLSFNNNYFKAIVELKETSNLYKAGVAAAQREYTKVGNTNNAYLIDTDDVFFQSDSVHYREEGHLQLGWNIFEIVKDL